MTINQLIHSSKLQAHSKRIKSICFSSNGKLLASSSKDKTIKVWQLETGNEIATLEGHSDDITSVAISVDNLAKRY